MEERFKTFTVLIAKANRHIRRIKTEEMAEFQLKSPHVSCLYYLYKMDTLTAKELCDVCEEDKSAISRSIESLESDGYIVCRSIHQKRYRSPFELTEKGREAGARIAEKIDRMVNIAGEGLSEEDRVIMYRSLSIICHNLEAIRDGYGNPPKRIMD